VPSENENLRKNVILFFDPMNNFAVINYYNQSISGELQEKARCEVRKTEARRLPHPYSRPSKAKVLMIYLFISFNLFLICVTK